MNINNYKFRNKTEGAVLSNISQRIIDKIDNLNDIILEQCSQTCYIIKYTSNKKEHITGSFIPVDCVDEEDIKELGWELRSSKKEPSKKEPSKKETSKKETIKKETKKICSTQENKLKKKASSQTSKMPSLFSNKE